MDKWRRQHLRFQQEQNQNYSSTKAILFPFHAQWCNVPTKTNGQKNSTTDKRQYRFSVMTIEETHQQYEHDLNKRKKEKKIHLISRVRNMELILLEFLY